MEIIKCDKCKKILKTEKNEKIPKKISGTIRSYDIQEWINFDLCEKCAQSLVKFIKNYLNKSLRKN